MRALLGAVGLAMAAATVAVAEDAPRSAVSVDAFASSDADDTEVRKAGVNLDWRYSSDESYQGIRLENAWFRPLGQNSTSDQRVYLRLADKAGDWSWKLTPGTDGHTVLGSAGIHNDAKYRQEYFLEREILETPRGLTEGVYYTFAGGALDLPVNDRNTFTVVAGLQEFTGDNVRTHLRVNYVHALKPEWGLSAQLRTRYFRSSEPGEYDYFSPRWYAEVIPVLQLRRYSAGWRYLIAGGIGGQKSADAKWRRSGYFNAQVTSPTVGKDWSFTGGVTYSDTPVGAGVTYDYQQINLGILRVF